MGGRLGAKAYKLLKKMASKKKPARAFADSAEEVERFRKLEDAMAAKPKDMDGNLVDSRIIQLRKQLDNRIADAENPKIPEGLRQQSREAIPKLRGEIKELKSQSSTFRKPERDLEFDDDLDSLTKEARPPVAERSYEDKIRTLVKFNKKIGRE